MASVIKRIFLVGGSYITSDTTSLWASEGLPVVPKKELSLIDCEPLFSPLGHLVGFSGDFSLLRVHRLERKEVGGGFL